MRKQGVVVGASKEFEGGRFSYFSDGSNEFAPCLLSLLVRYIIQIINRNISLILIVVDSLISLTRLLKQVDVNAIAQEVLGAFDAGTNEITPLTPPRRKFSPSNAQKGFLRKLGCPDVDIDACKSNKDVDALFKAYKDIPLQWQIDWLTSRGVTLLPNSREKARQIITRLRKELPASAEQMDYTRILWQHHNRSTSIPTTLTDYDASNLISHLKRTRPTTEGQRAQLRAFGLPKAQVLFAFVSIRFHCDNI